MTEMGGHGPLEGPPRDRYLERLETHLRMPPEAAWDVLDEVEAHIADAIAAGIDEGLTPEAAEHRALERLGPPDALGKDLRRTHQTRRRLLAAVGGGAWQAARGAVRGYLGGTVVMIGILLGATFLIAVAAIVARGFSVDIPISLGQVLIYGPLWGAIWVAGREMTTAISDRSLRSIESIRLPIASLGGGVVAAFVWFVPADHTRLTIALALATPLVFVSSAWTADREIGPWIFGERWETLGPKLRRRLFRAFIGTVIAALLTSFVVFALGWPSSAGTTVIEGDRPLLTPLERWRAAGYDVVAPRVVGSRVFSLAESYPEDGFVVARVPT